MEVFRSRFVGFLRTYRCALTSKALVGSSRQGAFAVQAPDGYGKTTILKEYTHYISYPDVLTNQTLFEYLDTLPEKPVLIGIDNMLEPYRTGFTGSDEKAEQTLKQILEIDNRSDGKMGIVMTDKSPLVALLYHQHPLLIDPVWFPETVLK